MMSYNPTLLRLPDYGDCVTRRALPVRRSSAMVLDTRMTKALTETDPQEVVAHVKMKARELNREGDLSRASPAERLVENDL